MTSLSAFSKTNRLEPSLPRPRLTTATRPSTLPRPALAHTLTPTRRNSVSSGNGAASNLDYAASFGCRWRNTTSTVTLTPTDTGSGAAGPSYRTNGSTPTTSSTQGTSTSLANTGVHTLKYF